MSESIWTAAPSFACGRPQPFIQSLLRQRVLATKLVHRGEMKEELIHLLHAHQAESEFARTLKIEGCFRRGESLSLRALWEPSSSEMRTPRRGVPTFRAAARQVRDRTATDSPLRDGRCGARPVRRRAGSSGWRAGDPRHTGSDGRVDSHWRRPGRRTPSRVLRQSAGGGASDGPPAHVHTPPRGTARE